jgi:hypothetical protein
VQLPNFRCLRAFFGLTWRNESFECSE